MASSALITVKYLLKIFFRSRDKEQIHRLKSMLTDEQKEEYIINNTAANHLAEEDDNSSKRTEMDPEIQVMGECFRRHWRIQCAPYDALLIF